MEFNNPSIEAASLPRAEEVELQPIEPAYWKVLRLEWFLTVFFFLAAGGLAIFFIRSIQTTLVIALASGIWLLVSAISYWLIRQSFRRKAYALREKDALYRTGWIVRYFRVCPFNRIQHCSVHAGPLERRYGLASISLYTAGSEGSDLKIPGLTEARAASIREFIMQKVRTDESAAG